RWTIADDLEQSRFYRLAVWDTATRICGISYEFAISGELSITVTEFEGYNEGTVDISPLRRGDAASSEGGGEIYSCGGSVGVGWNFTGLLEEVNVRVCQEPASSGTLAGLEDEDLQNTGSPVTEDGEFFICLDPVSGDVLANSSFLNASLTATAATTFDGTCGVWGKGFYAKVTWVDSGDADVFGLSNDPDAGGVSVPVLGGVFLKPNDSTPMSIAESQLISWEGRTGGGENAQVDIILRSKANLSDDAYYVVAAGNSRNSTDGEFSWDNPSEAFTADELASAATFEDRFFLEVFDAVGGGLICRSTEFSLEADDASNESDTSTLLLLLTPAALLLLCCCGVFFVACPYYDKIVRRRRNDRRPSLIDVDDTYIIDGEGQPAILALDSHVIPLAHAHLWPIDVTGSLSASRNGPSYVLRRAGSGNGGGSGGSGGGGGGGATTTNSGSWTRTVLAMGHSVTESIGRAAGLTIHSAGTSGSGGGGGRGAGGVGGSGGITGRNGSHVAGDHLALDDACSGVAAVAGRGASVAGSGEVVSSSSSWGGMRSGATWAFGGGGSIGRRSGGRRDGGGVYPTAAAALGLGLAPHHSMEEKSETAATTGGTAAASVVGGGGGEGDSSAASTSSNNNNNNLDGLAGFGGGRRLSGRGGVAGRGGGRVAGGGGGGGNLAEGGFFFVPAAGAIAPGAAAGGNAAAVAPADDSNSAPSASWYSRQSSLVDFAALLGRAENSSSNNNNNNNGGGAPESGGGWMPGAGRNANGAGVLG
ncbi:unnamed protein product, partial [Ectocarpus sp. 8 AP-2014]